MPAHWRISAHVNGQTICEDYPIDTPRAVLVAARKQLVTRPPGLVELLADLLADIGPLSEKETEVVINMVNRLRKRRRAVMEGAAPTHVQ